MIEMPSVAMSLQFKAEEIPPLPPEVPPTPPVEIPIPPFFEVVKAWWNSLDTLQKVLVVAGVSGSAITVVAISRRKKE